MPATHHTFPCALRRTPHDNYRLHTSTPKGNFKETDTAIKTVSRSCTTEDELWILHLKSSDMEKASSTPASSANGTQTLLSSIEEIVRLVQHQFDDTFYDTPHPALTYLAQRLSLTEPQALLFALFVEMCDNDRITLRDLTCITRSSTLRCLTLWAHIGPLIQRRLIRRQSEDMTDSYSVPQEVIQALLEDRVYTPPSIEHLSFTQLFEHINRIFLTDYRHGYRNTTAIREDIDDLIAANPQLTFCKTASSYNLNPDMRLLFYLFCHHLINFNNDRLAHSDWEQFFSRNTYRYISAQFNQRTLPLLQQNIIESCNANGLHDTQYRLTDDAQQKLFNGKSVFQQQSLNRHDLVDHSALAAKELFFPATVQAQIEQLQHILSPGHFNDIQQRLETHGMRKGFACLFYGLPGTGKTETVYQLARLTGRDLMCLNVTQIKSCWVGESEKNVKLFFDRYRDYLKQTTMPVPILLLNEADALLGIRQPIAQRAVDKMENALQNLFLEEIEQFEGILIATTNLTQNIDKAFERRFLYKIRFDKPSMETKRRIWQSMLPSLDQPTATTLAEQYDFSGGQIENIARKAIIHTLLWGEAPSLQQLQDFCQTETWDAPLNVPPRRIGF